MLVGEPGASDTEALCDAVGRAYVPNRIVIPVRPGADAPAPARDRPAVGGQATAYVCRGFTCSAPVTTAEALAALLAE